MKQQPEPLGPSCTIQKVNGCNIKTNNVIKMGITLIEGSAVKIEYDYNTSEANL